MELIAFIIGAAFGAAGYRYWRNKAEAQKPGPVVKPQGGGGPGEEGP